jgi:hypothetical protein
MDSGAELSIFSFKNYLVMSGFQVEKKKSSMIARRATPLPAPARRRSGAARTGPFWLRGSCGRRMGAVPLGARSPWQGGWHAAALLWLLVLPTETWGIFLGIDIGGGYKALLVSPERTTPCSFPAAQRQLRQRGNPSLSNLAVDGDLLCVLVKCNELVTDSLRKSCIIFLLKWLATVHVCTTQEKHLSWICTCLSSWRNRFYTLLLIISLGFIMGWHF